MPSDPGRGKVVAPIVRFKSANDKLALSSAFLVSSDEMKSFFVRHEYYLFHLSLLFTSMHLIGYSNISYCDSEYSCFFKDLYGVL